MKTQAKIQIKDEKARELHVFLLVADYYHKSLFTSYRKAHF